MATINANYLNLPRNYLFTEITRRVNAHLAENPGANLIRLGIGDVTSPLPPSVIAALHKAVDEQAVSRGFHGYGPEQGYEFLRRAIVDSAYNGLGIEADEIFISDGSKCDIGNFQEIFSESCRVAITDPVYPVYADSNVMAGRAGAMRTNGPAAGKFAGLIYLPCTVENGFIPDLPATRPDLIYLCYPNNPTGTVLTREQLAAWVNYARENESVILFDAAYEAFISQPDIPHSIYEIEGAREAAVEFRSYSKAAGFTGLRCGFTVVPKALAGLRPVKTKGETKGGIKGGTKSGGKTGRGRPVSLRDLWNRRQTTKYNGCPYIVQRAAEAVHSAQGQKETKAIIAGYLANARKIRRGFAALGLNVAGGEDAPYVWVQLPDGMESWAFFDSLLKGAGIVGTPGAGFGPSGEGYFRLTGFGDAADTSKAMERLQRFQF